MVSGFVVIRFVLDVDGKFFDVVLLDIFLFWGYVGIEEYGLGEKFCNNVIIVKVYIGKRILYYEFMYCKIVF